MESIELLSRLRDDAQGVLQVVAIQMQNGELGEAEDLDQWGVRRPPARPFLEQLACLSRVPPELAGRPGVEARDAAPGTVRRVVLTCPRRIPVHLRDAVPRQRGPEDQQVCQQVWIVRGCRIEELVGDRGPMSPQLALAEREIEMG